MSDILSEWKCRPLTAKQLERMACKNGSLTCGLTQKLGTGKCGEECKKRMLLLAEIRKVMGTGRVDLIEIFDKVKAETKKREVAGR